MSNSCYYKLEGYCMLTHEYPDTEKRCDFESTKKDEIIMETYGQCNAEDSNLIEICEDCYEEIDMCSCYGSEIK